MWKNQHDESKMSIDEIIEKIKHTPFDWNSKIDWKLILQHITYLFDININIIGFKLSKNFFQCEKHLNLCYFPYYIFQNTFIKFFNTSNVFKTINLLFYNKKYYILKNSNLLQPSLINYPIIKYIKIDNDYITQKVIQNVLKNNHVNYSYNIFYIRPIIFYPKKLLINYKTILLENISVQKITIQ